MTETKPPAAFPPARVTHGDRVWAPHVTAKTRDGKPQMRRAVVVATYGERVEVKDAFGRETWRVPLSSCVPVMDSGETGSESVKTQRELLSGAREKLALARRIIRGVE